MSYFPGDLQLKNEHEFALVEPVPGDPDVIETFNVWLYDGARNTGFNIHPRTTPARMESSVTAFLPDGRIARANHGAPGDYTDKARPHSANVFLECVKPFEVWEVSVRDAPVWITSDAEQAAGAVGDMTPTATVSIGARLTTTAPCWVNGALLPESRQTLEDQVSWWFGNRLVSGFSPLAFRYDHLLEGEGEIRFEGRILPMKGEGLKGHVRGVRRMPGMTGHTWAEGYSSDGRRGFGVTMFTREGGGYHHSEGFLFQDGKMHPARVIHLPHLSRDPNACDYAFELACDEIGLVRIAARERRAFWWRMQAWGSGAPILYGCVQDTPMLMRQGLARFTWPDGAVGHGLVERSG